MFSNLKSLIIGPPFGAKSFVWRLVLAGVIVQDYVGVSALITRFIRAHMSDLLEGFVFVLVILALVAFFTDFVPLLPVVFPIIEFVLLFLI